MDIVWTIYFWAIPLWTFLLIPFSTFYYEADDGLLLNPDGPKKSKLLSALCWTLGTIIVVGIIFVTCYLLLSLVTCCCYVLRVLDTCYLLLLLVTCCRHLLIAVVTCYVLLLLVTYLKVVFLATRKKVRYTNAIA